MKKVFALILWWILGTSGVFAAFVAKPYSLTVVGETRDVTVEIPISTLFEFPDTIPSTENLDNHDVTVAVESGDPDLIQFVSYSWYSGYKQNRIRLKRIKDILGKTEISVTLIQGSDTVKNVISYECLEVTASDLTVYANIDSPKKLDVLSGVMSRGIQHNVRNSGQENTVTLSIIDAPSYGTCEVDTIHYDKMNTAYYRSAIVYTPADGLENYTHDRFRYRITLGSGNYAEADIEVLVRKNALVARVIEFLPAPGQFTNESSFRDADCLIGKGSGTGTNSAPQTTGLVSLGGFGGYVILGFDQPIYNDPRHPYGVDFTVGGNSFVADYKGVWTEPGAVMVSRDDNNNGLADDEWFELAGSDYWFSTTHRNITMTYHDPAYNKRYTVPWTTDNGLAGALLTNQFHEQPYFPDPAIYPAAAEKTHDGTLSFTGTMIRSSLDKRVPSYIEFFRCPAFGYADNKTKQNGDLTVASNPYYDDENGRSADGFDISWAVDKDGNYVDLDHIDFVKIYTAGAVNAGWLGEWSTEVTGVGITNPDPDYIPRDYYINYASITQLQVPVGATCQYEGMAFKNGKPITEGEPRWWVDDESVGTIDNTGLFTGKAIGNTTIHFQQYADAPADEFEIEVVALTGVMIDIEGNASTVSNDSISCITGETIYINVESLTQNKDQMNGTTSNRYIYETYTWSNSDPETGTIDNGTFSALCPGETTLVVFSGIDPSLSDTIKVTVLEIPETKMISNPIRIPYYAASGSLTNDKIFTTGNDARVDMLSIDSSLPLNLKNNVLDYDFSSLDFGLYPADIATSTYGKNKNFATAFDYYADNYALQRQMIALTDTEIYGIATASSDVNDYIGTLSSGRSRDIIAQGAFVWAAKDNNLTRYNVSTGKAVAEAALSTVGDHSMAIYADRLLVADGKTLRRYYKTDLVPCGQSEFAADIDAVTSDGSYAWVVSGGKIEKLNLNNLQSMADVDLAGFENGARAYVSGSDIYIPSAAGTKLSMAVVSSGSVSVTECDDIAGSPSFFDADSVSIAVLTDSNRVRRFDIASGRWKEATAGYDAVADLSEVLKDGSVALDIMPAVGNNVAPVAKSLSTSTVYEYATSVSNSTKSKTTVANDHENNFSIYPRVTDDMATWLASAELQANGSLRIGVKPLVTVDADSLVALPVEIIDHAGVSAMTEVPYRISPRIYKPVIVSHEIDESTAGGLEYELPFDEVFVSQGSVYTQRNYRYTDTVVSSTLPDDVTVTVADNAIKLTAPASTQATGNIVISRTIAYGSNATYVPKTFYATIPVTLSDIAAIGDVTADRHLDIYPNPATDFIVLDIAGEASLEIFTMSGIRVMKTTAMPGESVNVAMLPAGTYIVKAEADGEVLTAKLIKK